MKTGIHKDIAFEDYTALEALNASTLKPYCKSPLHGLEAEFGERKDSDSMKLGRWVHEAVLEGTNWAQKAIQWEGGRRAGKVWDAFQEEHEGKHILKPEEWEKVEAICEAIDQHDAAEDLLFGEDMLEYMPEAELTVVADLDYMPVPACGIDQQYAKARLDIWDQHRMGIVDLKTISKLDSEQQITRQIETFGYDLQAAWYWDCIASVKRLSDDMFNFSFVFVCTAKPYDVAVVRMDRLWLEVGRKKYRDAIEARAAALDAKTGGYRPEGVFKEAIHLVPMPVDLDFGDTEAEEIEMEVI